MGAQAPHSCVCVSCELHFNPTFRKKFAVDQKVLLLIVPPHIALLSFCMRMQTDLFDSLYTFQERKPVSDWR